MPPGGWRRGACAAAGSARRCRGRGRRGPAGRGGHRGRAPAGRAGAAGGQARPRRRRPRPTGGPAVEPGRRARAVGRLDRGVDEVYYAALSDGGYCAELVTAGERRRGAVCTTDASAANHPIGVTIPFTDPVKADSPVTVSGRVELADAVSLELRYPDGATDRVRLGLGRFYVYDVPAEHLSSVVHAVAAGRARRGRQRAGVGGRPVRRRHPDEAERAHARSARSRDECRRRRSVDRAAARR